MNSAAEHLMADERAPLQRDDFARTAGLPESDVRELLEYGLLDAARLDTRTALALRQAAQRRNDFDLDLFTTGLLAGYLLRIADLEAEVQRLQAERPARTVYAEVSFTSIEITGRP